MNIFVFQSVPDRYDLRSKLLPGAHETWYATRYRSDMHSGDVVFFWMAGDERYRVGVIRYLQELFRNTFFTGAYDDVRHDHERLVQLIDDRARRPVQ